MNINLLDIKNNIESMKKKKVETIRTFNFWSNDLIKIDKEGDQYYFEIGNEMTTDIAEAVALAISMKNKIDDDFWNIEIKNIDLYNIRPDLAIYWLSGGDWEWKVQSNYKKNWHDCSLIFQEKFGMTIFSILKKSKTLGDIRNEFLKKLNISILYEFALENNLT
jgi:hypothetical protein